jgi:hypothetical protein
MTQRNDGTAARTTRTARSLRSSSVNRSRRLDVPGSATAGTSARRTIRSRRSPSARDCSRPAGTRPPRSRCTFNARHRVRGARTPVPPRAPPASTDSPAPGPPPPRSAPSRSRPPPSGRTPSPRDPPGYRPSVAQPGPSQPQQQPEAEHTVRPPVDDDLVPPSAHRVPFPAAAQPSPRYHPVKQTAARPSVASTGPMQGRGPLGAAR